MPKAHLIVRPRSAATVRLPAARRRSFCPLAGVLASCVAASASAGGGPGGCCDSGVWINEVRIAHPGMPQNNEYVELAAQPGAPLACTWYVVIGPGGIVEELVPLGGSVNPSGLYLIAEPSFDPAAFPGAPTPDLISNLNFVDFGNRTHLLVCACGGLPGIDEGVDLDLDNDGVIDWPGPLWDCVLDCISLVQNPVGAPTYCPTRRGPTPTGNTPPHVYRCRIPGTPIRPWRMGPFALPPTGQDSPDLPNPFCTGGPMFAGLLHEPIGAVTLSEVGGSLILSGFDGPGGGVGIDLGLADAMCLETDTFPMLADADCAEAGPGAPVMSIIGLGPSGAPLASATYRCTGPQELGLTLNFGIGDVGTMGVTAMLDGVVVASVNDVGPLPFDLPPIIIQWPLPGPAGCPIINDILHLPDGFPSDQLGWTATFDEPQTVTIVSGGFTKVTVDADQIIAIPNTPTLSPGLSRVEILCNGFAGLPIRGELVREFGNPHRALGDVLMLADGGPNLDRIEFHPLPGAEQFGTRIGLDYGPTSEPGVDIIGIIVRPESLDVLPPAASITLAPSVVLDGTPMPLGSLTEQSSGNGTSLIADLAPLNATFLDWSGLLDGVVVGQFETPGPFANLEVSPNTMTLYTYKFEVDGDRLYMRKCYLFPIVSPLFGGLVDEIVICGPKPRIYEFPTFEMYLDVFANNIPGFAIIQETPILSLITCPGDFDRDGEVGGADLGLMLNNWGQPGATDLDGDGTTGGSDLGIMLTNWGNCD